MTESDSIKNYYVYIYLDPTKPQFSKNNLEFEHEPIYVGCGTKNRWRDHLSQAKNREYLKTGNKYKFFKLKQILALGKEPIIIKYKENISRLEAFELEKVLVESIGMAVNNEGPLTNLVEGGRLNPVFNGEKNPMFGKPWSEERRKARSDMLKERNRNASKEEFDRLYRNRIVSEETRKKMSDATKGSNNPMYGRKKIKPPKEFKISKKIKLWEVTLPDGSKQEVMSLHAYCQKLGICQDSLKKAGKRGTPVSEGPAKGYSAIPLKRKDIEDENI